MSDATPLLHNMGYAPRASITWNGMQATSSAPAPEADTAWRVIWGCHDEYLDPEGRAHALVAEGRLSAAQVAAELLAAPAHGADAEALLIEWIRERAHRIGLPAVLPCSSDEAHIERIQKRGGGPHIADVLTAVTLQALCVGSLLVRDGTPRLSQVRAHCATNAFGKPIALWPVCLWLPYETVRRIETLYQETADDEPC